MRIWKWLFNPLTGRFEFLAVPIITVSSGAGGTISNGITRVETAGILQFNGGLDIFSSGELVVEPGASVIVV